jgi:hypothetical protein
MFLSDMVTIVVYIFLLHKLNFKDIHPNAIIESKNAIFLKDVFSFEKAQEDYSFNRTIEAGSYSYHHLKDDEVDPKEVKGKTQPKYLVMIF